jgi:DNA-binding NtrC family response regulator
MDSESNILIVESNILVRQPLAEYLRDCGYKVIEAASITEARQLLREQTIAVDIVLADAAYDQDGCFALATWVRSSQPGVEVVLAGTVAKLAGEAGDLCAEGPAPDRPLDHRQVLERIKQAIAARDRSKH